MATGSGNQVPEPCSNCAGRGEIVTPVVIGYDKNGNPIIDHQAIICAVCYGSGNA